MCCRLYSVFAYKQVSLHQFYAIVVFLSQLLTKVLSRPSTSTWILLAGNTNYKIGGMCLGKFVVARDVVWGTAGPGEVFLVARGVARKESYC